MFTVNNQQMWYSYNLNCSILTNSSMVSIALRTKFIFLPWSILSALCEVSLLLQVSLLDTRPSIPPPWLTVLPSTTLLILAPCRHQALLSLLANGTCCCSLCLECFPSLLLTDIGIFLYLNSLSEPLIHLFIAFKSHNYFIVAFMSAFDPKTNLHRTGALPCSQSFQFDLGQHL